MAEVALRDYVNEIDGMIENSAFDVAIQHCRHILSLYPKYLEVYRVLGKALLEKDDYAAAGDVFQRVVGVDPEDFVARVGLSIVHDRQSDLDKAIWHMERAYDLMPSNEIIQSELRRLYERRDGHELERISLTRSALARMYANGDLVTEAIADLKQLLADQTDRADLQVLLAEMLWRDNQRLEAANLAQAITAKLPYCLKANLILGEILESSGSSDSETPLRRAQAADPDNRQAVQLFGSESPLPERQTMVTRLEQMSYGQLLETEGAVISQEEVPDWLRGLADLNAPMSQLEAPESATNPPLATGLHMPGTEPLPGEIPDWLQGLTTPAEPAAPSQELPDWLAALGTASLTEAPAKSAAAEPSDDWLAQLQLPATPQPVTAMRDEEVPDWILQLGTGALDPNKVAPPEPTAEAAPVVEAAPAPDETPDWMKQLGTTGMLDTASTEPAVSAVDDETPDWLKQLGSTGPLDQTPRVMPAARSTAAPTESADVPDWLQQLGSTGPLDRPAQPSDSSTATPDWLSQLQVTTPPVEQPSTDDDTPDWLAQLGNTGPLPAVETPPARKISVDASRATIERLVEAFSPGEAEPSEPEQAEVAEESSAFALGDAAREVGQAGAGLVLGGAALAGAAASGLAGLVGEHASSAEEVPASPQSQLESTQPAALEAAAILEGDISPEDALAFFARLSAGKEDQLRAEAEAEAETRMAAIMGRKIEPAKPVEPEPVAVVEPEPVAAIEPEPVAEVIAPAEVSEPAALEAAAILEGDISPEDALAFFARLSAGKEDQLRAEAEAEAETRMAAIMGRKIEPARPVEPEPVAVIEPEPVAAIEPEPVAEVIAPAEVSEPAALEAAAILEGDISPEDALAFFARLSAGKEDQLRAEAEAEAETRMAAIMGRKIEPAKPVEPEPIAAIEPEPVAVIEPEPVAAIEPEPVAEVVAPVEVSDPAALDAAAILEGDISPEDALAFFARLSAGKEDQLRAEAEAEAETRMAAIMGRKPTAPLAETKPVEPVAVIEPEPVAAIEPEPVAEVVAPAEVSEPAALDAAAILEGDISPEDALAFFARLSAGKEDQLRAEAEAEAETRMAAIMGRKPTAPLVETKPIEPVAAIEPEPVVSIEPEVVEPAATADAADWLAQLSAATAAATAEPEVEAPVDESQDWLKSLSESAAVPVATDELPDWLRAMRPPEESLAAEVSSVDALSTVEATPAEELPDWLRAMQPVSEATAATASEPVEESAAVDEAPVAEAAPASELPDWLQDLQPAAAAELTPAEALPDWLRNLQPEAVEVVANQEEASERVMDVPQSEETPISAEPIQSQAEEAVPLAEGLPEPILTPVSTLVQPLAAEVKAAPAAPTSAPAWWTQSAEDEGEMPIAELPEPVRMVSATARMTPVAAAPAAPRPPITRAMRDRLPERATREPRRRETRPAEPRYAEAPTPVVSSVNVNPLVEQLEADKFNHAVRLELARAWWSMGNRDSALTEYGKLINPAQVENLSDEERAEIEERDFADAGPLADDLIVDLERIVEIDDHPAWPRLLGDLYMKTGDLGRALDMYRRALSQL